jgi:hypothetical protein
MNHHPFSPVVAFGLSLVLVATAVPTGNLWAADDTSEYEARVLYGEALKLRGQGKPREALEKLKLARAHKATPVVLLELGKVHEELHELVEAVQAYQVAAAMAPEPGETALRTRARVEAAQRFAAVTPRIPTLRVVVTGVPEGETVAVTVDGKHFATNAAPRQINPGKHMVVARRTDGTEERSETELREGAYREVLLSFAAPSALPVPPPYTRGPDEPAPPPQEPEGETPHGAAKKADAPRKIVGTLGVALGYGLTMGNFSQGQAAIEGTNSDMSAVQTGAAELRIDATFRLSPNFGVGFYGGFGIGTQGSQIKTACANADCTLYNLRGGLQADFHIDPGSKVDPWVGVLGGLEYWTLSFSPKSGGTSASGSISALSPEVGVHAGLDLALSRKLGLGPTASFMWGKYGDVSTSVSGGSSKTWSNDGGTHTLLFLGLRGMWNF